MTTFRTRNNSTNLFSVSRVKMIPIAIVTIQWNCSWIFTWETVTSYSLRYIPVFSFFAFLGCTDFAGVLSVKMILSLLVAVKWLRSRHLWDEYLALSSLRGVAMISTFSFCGSSDFICVRSVEVISSIPIAIKRGCASCEIEFWNALVQTYIYPLYLIIASSLFLFVRF